MRRKEHMCGGGREKGVCGGDKKSDVWAYWWVVDIGDRI